MYAFLRTYIKFLNLNFILSYKGFQVFKYRYFTNLFVSVTCTHPGENCGATMKWLAIVVICFVLVPATVNCQQCDFGSSIDYDRNKVEGNWFVVYAAPNIYNQFSKLTISITLTGDIYNTTANITYANETTPVILDATWQIKENKDFDMDVPDLPSFSGSYRFIAVEDGKHVIYRGCPSGFNGQTLTVVMAAEQCPNEDKVKEAIENANLTFSSFSRDPTVIC
ncbi:hypothetical protein L9F63_020797 [Diploptera punctata]|uniref:Uncharacterized protein n=1 Tax=Diploptera punctata TaxID=6984 RepID=A0AAD8ECC6_DIPPU|nr:hypothetical protein L9F63_020797 [Diploptera punctata]